MPLESETHFHSELENAEATKILEYKRFITSHAPQLSRFPIGTYQLALNQSLSANIVKEAEKVFQFDKNLPYIEWVNRPKAGDFVCVAC